jgi:hypothetical protein
MSYPVKSDRTHSTKVCCILQNADVLRAFWFFSYSFLQTNGITSLVSFFSLGMCSFSRRMLELSDQAPSDVMYGMGLLPGVP